MNQEKDSRNHEYAPLLPKPLGLRNIHILPIPVEHNQPTIVYDGDFIYKSICKSDATIFEFMPPELADMQWGGNSKIYIERYDFFEELSAIAQQGDNFLQQLRRWRLYHLLFRILPGKDHTSLKKQLVS